MALQATPTAAVQQVTYQPGTNNPRDINSIVGGMVDRSPWRWWDTWTNPLASPTVPINGEINFFQIPVNSIDPLTGFAKTVVDTNMKSPGQFNPPYCLVMDSFGFYIESNDTLADIKKVFGNCRYQLYILGKVFFEGLLWMAPGGFGFMGTPNQAGTGEIITNGFPAPQATYRFNKYARYIPPLTNFGVRLIFPNVPGTSAPPTLASAFKLVCYLDGLSDNPVQ